MFQVNSQSTGAGRRDSSHHSEIRVFHSCTQSIDLYNDKSAFVRWCRDVHLKITPITLYGLDTLTLCVTDVFCVCLQVPATIFIIIHSA